MAAASDHESPHATALPPTLHASVVSAGGRGALIRGPSGAGKSDLVLRCIAVGATPSFGPAASLVADDRVIVRRDGDRLFARAPDNLAGLIEVRGLGIVRLPYERETELRLVVDLVAVSEVERMPDPMPECDIDGVRLPALRLDAFAPSAPLKLLLALARL